MARKFVIYHDDYGWNGAAEFELGRWPFKKIEHAPVTHADTAMEVFDWLYHHYRDSEISYDPAVSRRYTRRYSTETA